MEGTQKIVENTVIFWIKSVKCRDQLQAVKTRKDVKISAHFRWSFASKCFTFCKKGKMHRCYCLRIISLCLHSSLYVTCNLEYQSCWKAVLWAMSGLQRSALKGVVVLEEVKRFWVLEVVCCDHSTRCFRHWKVVSSSWTAFWPFERWAVIATEFSVPKWWCAQYGRGKILS